jgi:hypothetical protein
VIALELLLGYHVPLGDILEESHTKKIEGYLHKIRDAHPLCLSFIRSSLQFYPEKRKAASLIFLPKPESKVPEEWLLFCASISHENPNVETTDPMDVIFHTEEEELAQSFFLSMEDITMNELTEEILPQESLHLKTSSSEITNKKESLVLISILVIIIALLILIAVIL